MPDSAQSSNNSMENNFKKPEVIIAFDFGVKKMGVAIGNTITNNSRALDIVSMNNGQPEWDSLLDMIQHWKANIIVVGLPLNMDGTESMLAKRAKKFARRLAHKLMEQKSPIKVLLHDERLSSFEAREIAWEQGLISDIHDPIDDISACLLLNSYFAEPNSIMDVTAYNVND